MEFTRAWNADEDDAAASRKADDPASEDLAEFERSFAPLRNRLVRLVASLIGPSDAEDVVQDTYLIARRRLSQLRDRSALEPWLYRITVNAAYSRKRRHRTEARLLPHITDPTVAPAERDLGLLELVEGRPPQERALLVLHYGYGYRLLEIGQILGMTEGAVKTRLFRVRRTLLRQLTEASDA
jgi:RNA polymerase sigma-70 factor (ECF subfamily)